MRLAAPIAAPPTPPPAASLRTILAELPVAYDPGDALAMPRGPERRARVAERLAAAEADALARVAGQLHQLREDGVVQGWRLLPNTGVVAVSALEDHAAAAQQALESISQLGDVVPAGDLAPRPAPGPPDPPLARGTRAWQLDALGAVDAWRSGARGQGIAIGFVDSGVVPTHPELRDRLRGGGDAHARPWIDLLDGRSDVRDPYGHGTTVASVAVGRTPDGAGIGVAPDSTLVMARAFGKAPDGVGGTLASKLEGIGWMLAPTRPDGSAADPAAAPDIVNLSFGERAPRTGVFRTALRALEDAGVLVVAAAGNGGRRGPGNVLAPARYDTVLAVGMTDRDGVVEERSAHHSPSLPSGRSKPDLVAPGVDTVAASNAGGYVAATGTSIASAIAAGAAAVVWSAAPTLLPAQVREVLRRSARDVAEPGHDPVAGAGLIDLAAAVRLARTIEQGNP